jgi:signal peptidase II
VSAGRHGSVAALAVTLVALALDQVSKAVVRAEIARGERIELVAGVDLVRVGNEGIAFGLLDGAGAVVLVLAAASFLVLLAYFAVTSHLPGLWLPIGLLAGGALGNLIDRVTAGEVTDFIDPPRWPAFNLADVEITVGVILLGFLYLRGAGDSDEAGPDGGAGSATSRESENGQR